jgi:hypothetical protein
MKLLLIITLFISSLFGWVAEITALIGNANITRDNNQTIPATLHMKLDKKDVIKTDKDTKMQLIFKDNTVITVGKNSVLKISDYLFDGTNSKADFKLQHGIMKTLTGKIGKLAPRRFKVLTKNASIGIRGTYFVVESYDDIIKVGMIMGSTDFTNLDNMKQVVITKGEQLVFNEKQPENIKIEKNFLEPKETKLTPPAKVEKVEETTQTIQNEAEQFIKNVTNSNSDKSTHVFTGFIKGLFK